ncbi:hypothetical protein D9M71_334200 [compost metagenome]
MDIAFIQNPQHQVHRQQRAEDHQRLALLAGQKGVAGTRHLGDHFLGQADLGDGTLHGNHGRVQADPGGQVEGDVFRSELALVADPVIGQAVFITGEGRQRHPRTVGSDYLDLFEGVRILGILGVDLHHHLILVQAVVDGGNLPLAVGIVEHRGDHAHVDAQALGLIAVDHQGDLLRAPALLGIDGGQLRQGLERRHHFRIPLAQGCQVAALQDVLVLRRALFAAAAELQILIGHEEQAPAGDLGHVLAQTLDDLLRGKVALLDGLQLDQNHRVVDAAVAADEARHTFDRRVLEDGAPVGFHLRLHDRERQAVVAAHEADQLAGVLLRQEGLGHHHIQGDVDRNGHQQAGQGQPWVAQHPAQAAVVDDDHALVDLPAPALQAVFRTRHVGLEPARAEHRGQGQGDQQRHHDGRRQGNGELAEQVLDDAAHEQDRQEHRHQRGVHGQ